MRFNFSSDFVKVIVPDTSFADAWETICYTLLKREFGESDIINLKAKVDVANNVTLNSANS